MRKITLIVIHCSDTTAVMNTTVEDIRRWHVEENKWDDIGYHYVIERDGQVKKGREENVIGAHARGHNSESLGVCMVGGCSQDGKAEVNFTPAQWRAAEELCINLRWKHTEAEIVGHNNLDDHKQCPTFNAKVWGQHIGE